MNQLLGIRLLGFLEHKNKDMAKIGNIEEVQNKLVNGVYPINVLVKQFQPKHTFEIELTSENWHATPTMEDDEKFFNWSVEAKLGSTVFTVFIDLFWGDIELF